MGTSEFISTHLTLFSVNIDSEIKIPLISSRISAGFPSPAIDFVDLSIDMNRHLVKHPSSTFYGRVKGHSMKNAGIFNDDLLVIDKSLEPSNGKIAICYIDGEFTVKRIKIEKKCIWLMAENKEYEPILVTQENDFLIWGIVTHVIKAL